MTQLKYMRFGEQPPISRGNGAMTYPLVGGADGTDAFTAGISHFPPGLNVPMHSHNVEEMVTVLEGSGECEIDGVVRPVGLFDTTFIPGGVTPLLPQHRRRADEDHVGLRLHERHPNLRRHRPDRRAPLRRRPHRKVGCPVSC